MGILSFLRAERRRRILERFPITGELWDWALKEYRIFRGLDPEDEGKLRALAAVFLAEKVFRPVRGADLDERTKVSIAAQACLPVLGLGIDWYSDWTTILVTPRGYGVRQRDVDTAGVVTEYDDELAGEVFDLGPVALSLEDVAASGWGDCYNVVIHEMAHKLDGRDGSIDGCPPLHRGMDPGTWRRVFTAAYQDLRMKVGRSPLRRSRRLGPRLDPYAAESPDEFFAVACEYFFEKPLLLRSVYAETYAQLALFFRRDPLGSG
ncbi:MAG TPA: M90 family metallopeptidase [Magnetospirillaceae bacterium]|nr:M90 family metallopeptidase [Magnetospirillaceae bacterium]